MRAVKSNGSRPARKAQHDRPTVIGGDGNRRGEAADTTGLFLAAEGFDAPLRGTKTHFVNGVQVGEDPDNRLARDELHQIEPMRADVGNGPQLAPFTGQHAPIEVGRL